MITWDNLTLPSFSSSTMKIGGGGSAGGGGGVLTEMPAIKRYYHTKHATPKKHNAKPFLGY